MTDLTRTARDQIHFECSDCRYDAEAKLCQGSLQITVDRFGTKRSVQISVEPTGDRRQVVAVRHVESPPSTLDEQRFESPGACPFGDRTPGRIRLSTSHILRHHDDGVLVSLHDHCPGVP